MGTVKKKVKSRDNEFIFNGVKYVVDWDRFEKEQKFYEEKEREAIRRGFR